MGVCAAEETTSEGADEARSWNGALSAPHGLVPSLPGISLIVAKA